MSASNNRAEPPNDEDVTLPAGTDNDVADNPENVPIEDHEFPDLFLESQGRLFSSHGSAYPLPVDGHEQTVSNVSLDGMIL